MECDWSRIDGGRLQSSKRRDPELRPINARNCQKWMLTLLCDIFSFSPRLCCKRFLVAYGYNVEWCLYMTRCQKDREGRCAAATGQGNELFVRRKHVRCGLIKQRVELVYEVVRWGEWFVEMIIGCV